MSALMGRLGRQLLDIEAELAAEVRRYHLRAQLGRLLAGVFGAVVLSVLANGPGPLDWHAIAPVAAGALWAQLRAIWPTIPWDLLRRVAQRQQVSASSTAAPGPAPAGAP